MNRDGMSGTVRGIPKFTTLARSRGRPWGIFLVVGGSNMWGGGSTLTIRKESGVVKEGEGSSWALRARSYASDVKKRKWH